MKRTLALILTLCMALSMFSFPALAAELNAAPLEVAPVENQTTTPAEAPAVTGDVTAQAAASTGLKLSLKSGSQYTSTGSADNQLIISMPYNGTEQSVQSALNDVRHDQRRVCHAGIFSRKPRCAD